MLFDDTPDHPELGIYPSQASMAASSRMLPPASQTVSAIVGGSPGTALLVLVVERNAVAALASLGEDAVATQADATAGKEAINVVKLGIVD